LYVRFLEPPLSWLVIGVITLVYWVLLFLRMRARGRREFDRALEQAASTHHGGESFEVKVSVQTNPLRSVIVVFAVPIALVLLHLFAARRVP
jgi:hypothetical protein